MIQSGHRGIAVQVFTGLFSVCKFRESYCILQIPS